MASHHPDTSLLASYASGQCSSEESMLLASHVSLCASCSGTLETLEAVGGAMLGELPEVPLGDRALDALLARLDEDMPVAANAAPPKDAIFPAPLREFIGMASHEVPWQTVTSVLKVFSFARDAKRGPQLRLMQIKAGQAVPNHGHHGRELTLVLSGGFSDHQGHYLRGDVAIADELTEHTPVADVDSDCICLALNDGAIRPTGLVERLVMPFVKF